MHIVFFTSDKTQLSVTFKQESFRRKTVLSCALSLSGSCPSQYQVYIKSNLKSFVYKEVLACIKYPHNLRS